MWLRARLVWLIRPRHWAGWLGWRLGQLLRWIWNLDGSPAQRARGLGVGVFLGCFPLFGLQTVGSVALARLLRGHPLLAAVGTWISNPITDLPLLWFNYSLGCGLIGAGPAWPGLEGLRQQGLEALGWELLSRLLLGSAFTGTVLSLTLGWLCWWWLRRQVPDTTK